MDQTLCMHFSCVDIEISVCTEFLQYEYSTTELLWNSKNYPAAATTKCSMSVKFFVLEKESAPNRTVGLQCASRMVNVLYG